MESMKRHDKVKRAALLALAVTMALLPQFAAAAAVGTAFTYQGQLKSGGAAVNDTCASQFALFDAATAGTQIGSNLTPSLTVTNGVFSASLDFGSVGHFN